MLALRIFVSADGMMEGEDPKKIVEATDISIGVLEKGTVSGAPSVPIALKLPDGTPVLAQTSLKLFQAAARVFAAQYGWIDRAPNQSSTITEGSNRNIKKEN